MDGLATFRLVKLVRDDRITQPLRDAVEARYGSPESSKIAYLMDCPWCLSIYFGVGLTLLHRRWPRAASMLSRTLALSAMTGLAAEHLDGD
ncbi:DUF1360 domain-containing protein [Nocardioides gilvus]|uniref:DUF1360 domain-containing protein n=1 Tax=Nocardioides gilvus TaxID=1735589 RepID=UPI0013A5355F|nr:DUF1360 domain-containing protein [Nocardioides gilvus]